MPKQSKIEQKQKAIKWGGFTIKFIHKGKLKSMQAIKDIIKNGSNIKLT